MKVTIKGKEIDLELTDEQKVVVERALRPETGWERVAFNTRYFRTNIEDLTNSFIQGEDDYSNLSYNKANYFSSEELAINIARAQMLQRKLWRRSAELCEKEDWKNKISKYYICYNYSADELIIYTCNYLREFGQVYFDTEKHAKQVLEEFRDELTWYFTEFKSRMD